MTSALSPVLPTETPSRWELAAETIAVKIRWVGLVVGYVLVNLDVKAASQRGLLNAILALGALYTLLDTWYSLRGKIFLGRSPLVVSSMEALFIGVLCYHYGGLESPFRYYYFLSLICCAIRHSSQVTYASCAAHCLSYGLLYLALPQEQRLPLSLVLTLVVLGWVTWASDAMSLLLKRVGEYLGELNRALRANQSQLEDRIAERTRELQEAQAHVLHQEKMASFGLLAAGIAHEVGNPLTSISSLVQMLQRRNCDEYTAEKLALVSGQLQRIQHTLRELIHFSRPANDIRTRVSLKEILQEALDIARYYKRPGDRLGMPEIPGSLPLLVGVHDQLVQVFLNLILNAIDATSSAARQRLREPARPVTRIEVAVHVHGAWVEVTVADDGCGIPAEHAQRLFQPYFTTKKEGTGLGLFVTRKLVEEHGGTVTFEPRAGGGALFRVTLPVEPLPSTRPLRALEGRHDAEKLDNSHASRLDCR